MCLFLSWGMSLNGCLGHAERGAWRGVGRKGWQKRLAKGWHGVGEGLAKVGNASLFTKCLFTIFVPLDPHPSRIRVKQVRFGKLVFLQQNWAFFGPKICVILGRFALRFQWKSLVHFCRTMVCLHVWFSEEFFVFFSTRTRVLGMMRRSSILPLKPRKCAQFPSKSACFTRLPPPNQQNEGFALEFLLEGPQTELRTLSQNREQTLQKLRTNRIMNKRAFLKRVGRFPCTLQFCSSRGARSETLVCDSMVSLWQANDALMTQWALILTQQIKLFEGRHARHLWRVRLRTLLPHKCRIPPVPFPPVKKCPRNGENHWYERLCIFFQEIIWTDRGGGGKYAKNWESRMGGFQEGGFQIVTNVLSFLRVEICYCKGILT